MQSRATIKLKIFKGKAYHAHQFPFTSDVFCFSTRKSSEIYECSGTKRTESLRLSTLKKHVSTYVRNAKQLGSSNVAPARTSIRDFEDTLQFLQRKISSAQEGELLAIKFLESIDTLRILKDQWKCLKEHCHKCNTTATEPSEKRATMLTPKRIFAHRQPSRTQSDPMFGPSAHSRLTSSVTRMAANTQRRSNNNPIPRTITISLKEDYKRFPRQCNADDLHDAEKKSKKGDTRTEDSMKGDDKGIRLDCDSELGLCKRSGPIKAAGVAKYSPRSGMGSVSNLAEMARKKHSKRVPISQMAEMLAQSLSVAAQREIKPSVWQERLACYPSDTSEEIGHDDIVSLGAFSTESKDRCMGKDAFMNDNPYLSFEMGMEKLSMPTIENEDSSHDESVSSVTEGSSDNTGSMSEDEVEYNERMHPHNMSSGRLGESTPPWVRHSRVPSLEDRDWTSGADNDSLLMNPMGRRRSCSSPVLAVVPRAASLPLEGFPTLPNL